LSEEEEDVDDLGLRAFGEIVLVGCNADQGTRERFE
jgi:hypothetical protein